MTFVHASLNESVQAFKDQLNQLAENHDNLTVHHRYSEPASQEKTTSSNVSFGFVDAAFLSSHVQNKNADYYFCGPAVFMQSIDRVLTGWNIPESQINFEFFGPKQDL